MALFDLKQLYHFLFQISVTYLDNRIFFNLLDFQKVIIKKMRKKIQEPSLKEKLVPIFQEELDS